MYRFRRPGMAALGLLTLVTMLDPHADSFPNALGKYPARFELGEPTSATRLAQLHTTIPPNGDGLPPGSGSYSQGEAIYREKCAGCHGMDLEGTKTGTALIRGRDTLNSNRPLRTVESFWPFAPSVFSYIRNTMPTTQPGSLSNDEAYAVVAYILASAGIISEDAEMDANALAGVSMPNKDGFVMDDRPDIKPILHPKQGPTIK